MVFSYDIVINHPDSVLLKPIFSVFYPVAIVPKHDHGFNRELEYYGVCGSFDEIEEGQQIPEYTVSVQTKMKGRGPKYIINFTRV